MLYHVLFSNQSSFVPFSTIQLCSPALCPSLTKAWIVFRAKFRAKFCTPASFGVCTCHVRISQILLLGFLTKDLPIWTRGHYPTRNQMYLFINGTYFSDVEMEFLVCTCHVRLICLFIYVYPLENSFVGHSLFQFLTTHLAQKAHDISSILSGISQYQKHTISLSQGNLTQKKRLHVSSLIKPGMELRIFNGIIY